MESLYERLLSRLGPVQVRRDEMLAGHTTFKIGGPVDIFVEPNTIEELQFVMQVLTETKANYLLLGMGSNMLVRDGGIRGVVVSLCGLRHVKERHDDTLRIGAGYSLKELSEWALEEELTGLEFAIGIPGSVGGAVFMNAGAYEGEMSFVVDKVVAVTPVGEVKVYLRDELGFAYRHSAFQDSGDVVAEVQLQLTAGKAADMKALMDDLTERRESKQPLEYASAGSTFKRPPGYYAGTLIDQTGLKGLAVGDAEVSTKHAGFVINKGSARAKDVLALIEQVKARILEAHGVHLETEVRIVGDDER